VVDKDGSAEGRLQELAGEGRDVVMLMLLVNNGNAMLDWGVRTHWVE
jgi:hypothetical protein